MPVDQDRADSQRVYLTDFINYPLKFSWRFISLEPVCEGANQRRVSRGSVFSHTGDVDGRPLVAMIDMGLRGLADKQGLSFFLSLSTSLISPTSEGLPTRSDADNLNIWEDAVEERLQSAGKFVFVGRVTWNGRRELLYYVGNQHSTLETLRIMSGVHSTRPFAFICEPDDEWERVGVWLNRH